MMTACQLVLLGFAAASAFLAGIAVMLAVDSVPGKRRRGFDVVEARDAIDEH